MLVKEALFINNDCNCDFTQTKWCWGNIDIVAVTLLSFHFVMLGNSYTIRKMDAIDDVRIDVC